MTFSQFFVIACTGVAMTLGILVAAAILLSPFIVVIWAMFVMATGG